MRGYDRDFPSLPSPNTSGNAATKKKMHTPAVRTISLNDLPNELILEICEYLPGIDMDDFQLPTLASLSLVNHRFHRIVAKKLFRSYDSHFCEPYLFLRTMSSSPQLAALVQQADLSYGEDVHKERKRYAPSAQDKKLIKERVRELRLPGWKKRVAFLNKEDADVDYLYSGVLMYTSNIRSLIIRGKVPHWSTEWLDLLRNAATGARYGYIHRFEHLRSINVDASCCTLGKLGVLFRLPALRQLIFQYLCEFQVGEYRPICTQLEDLQFETSWINLDLLRLVMASMQQLKSFKLEMSMESMDLMGDHDDICKWDTTLTTVLRPLQFSLETLWVTCCSFTSSHTYYLSKLNLQRALRNFSALKTLQCPLSLLVGPYKPTHPDFFTNLPPTLVTLRLELRTDTIDTSCLSMLENSGLDPQPDSSQLAEVRFLIGIMIIEPQDHWTYLTDLFAQTRVKLVIDHCTFSDDWENNSWRSSVSVASSQFEVPLYSDGSAES